MEPIRIFFSYAHEDEKFRIELQKHLIVLKRNNKIVEWNDRCILPGGNWENEINENIDHAQIILMLVSPDFIGSSYCSEKETKRALERHYKKEATVIPIIIRPCNWKRTPFSNLQVLPRDGVTVSEFNNWDKAWVEVTNGLFKVIDHYLQLNISEHSETRGDIKTREVSENKAEKIYEEQLLMFLKEHRKYWFSPVNIKRVAVGAEGLSLLEVSSIIECCDRLTQRGLLAAMQNAKGNKMYKII